MAGLSVRSDKELRVVVEGMVPVEVSALGSGWLGRDWLGIVGGCSLAVAGPSSVPNGVGVDAASKLFDAPELEKSGGKAFGNEVGIGVAASIGGIGDGGAELGGAELGSGELGSGELDVGSDLGVENGEGERSDGATGAASVGSALVEGNA